MDSASGKGIHLAPSAVHGSGHGSDGVLVPLEGAGEGHEIVERRVVEQALKHAMLSGREAFRPWRRDVPKILRDLHDRGGSLYGAKAVLGYDHCTKNGPKSPARFAANLERAAQLVSLLNPQLGVAAITEDEDDNLIFGTLLDALAAASFVSAEDLVLEIAPRFMRFYHSRKRVETFEKVSSLT